ncbi:hypothetical protein LGL55_05980 [Clostridium tagluense]|uniref:hypothetical protein n=1 Tax=Clostridium tagluense TaxID=360422 RepID=UPI001CF4F41A|nr:hypothetical protein [Clostridium tagluense]MCB2310671.1 hypothetical protein [Clostridium tagluense]MCB2315599.1 hypothetical protein [Clostridium tagluense]MCB2320453.1 hypothetical protein [Clostridium tagluense]MCB2325264.1 hypothetical protein [Clostridium tagluense]MCB2330116.1 hypothetical protein [Clostridium tagluense]
MDNSKVLKEKYNSLLQREKKACLYLNNKNIKLATIEKSYIPEFQKITIELNEIARQIKGATKDELLNGFKD